MTLNDVQRKWNDRWSDKAPAANWQPDSWLQRVSPLLPRGAALDIACGIGRNALYLAEQGLSVTAVDISDVALAQLEQEAKRRGLKLSPLQLDLENGPSLPPGPFDLVLNMFYLYRPLVPQLLALVRPGGVAVFRTFSQAGADCFGAAPADIALHEAELLEIFSGWEVLQHEEGVEPSAKGGSLAGIIARRPD